MKRCIWLACLMSPVVTFQAFAALQIQFEISGVRSEEGKLYVQLFKGEQNYLTKKPEVATIVPAKTSTTTLTFNNLGEGEYALRYFHDENGNGGLDSNFFGIPAEGYGFSNDAKPHFGPPSYEEIKFRVATDASTVVNHSSVIY